MNIRRAKARRQTVLDTRSGLRLGALLLLGCGLNWALPGSDAQAQTSPVAASKPSLAASTIETLAETLAALDAASRGQGHANIDAPLYAAAKPNGKAQGFLCLVQSEPHDTCPAAPTGSITKVATACTLCSNLERDRAWQRYVRTELSVRALGVLLAIKLDQAQPSPAAEQLVAWLKSLESSAPRGKALQTALSELFSAQTPKARSTAFRKQLQSVLDALGLSMTPDDLGEEGGLRATLKLAGHTRDAARNDWQQHFNTWSQCHAGAIASGQLGLSDPSEVERCNRRAAPNSVVDSAILAYRRQEHERRACLDSTLQLQLTIAQYQTTACADGALVSGR